MADLKHTKTSFFHRRNIAKVRPFLTQQDAEELVKGMEAEHLCLFLALFKDVKVDSC